MTRKPDWESAEFWEWAIAACRAAPHPLSIWFPEASRQGWDGRKRRAAQMHQIAFPWLSRSNKPTYPDEPPEGWPVRDENKTVPPPPKDVAECVEHDSEVDRLRREVKHLNAKYQHVIRDTQLEDRVVERIHERIPQLAPVPTPTFSKRSGGRPESVVALWSDSEGEHGHSSRDAIHDLASERG